MNEKILIVDDSEDLRRLLSVMLKKLGYNIEEAGDGKEGIKKAHDVAPDLILLDIIMPETDGYEVCKRLKEDDHTKDIPVIFLSAMSEAADKIKGLEMGGVDYITKPFDKGEVIARVQNQLKIRRLTNELIKTNKELTEKQRRLDEDLQAAAGIQQSLLPQKLPMINNLQVAWKFIPSGAIGGDIFNIIRLDDDNIAFYMLDVSGHGVPSALVTVSVSQTLLPHMGYVKRERSDQSPNYEIASPREVLKALDAEYPLNRFDKYFTATYLIINTASGRLIYSNAAHPPPVLLHKEGGYELLDKGGTIIGMGGIMPFEEESKYLRDGDKIIIYTDGVIEYKNSSGDDFGEKRLYFLLESLKDLTIERLLNRVMESIDAFGQGTKLQDDLSLVGIEYKKQNN